MKNILLLLFVFYCFAESAIAQYAPPAGQLGSSAIWKDSSIFVNWAKACSIVRGYQQISDTVLGLVFAGNDSMATGKALENATVSLGDGGFAICTFEHPIINGPGADFAVFENSFDGLFLELAFVEVSSNGIDFVRFPAHSLTDTNTQKSTFDLLDATQLNNLAGKYRAGFGTPFDLEELVGNPSIDVNNITHVKIVDVVGSIENAFASRDAWGNKVNDPWPTAFETGGFDLDAVGVIHQNAPLGIAADYPAIRLLVFPNPVERNTYLHVMIKDLQQLIMVDAMGREVKRETTDQFSIDNLPAGVYQLHVQSTSGNFTTRIVIQ